jgi:hypothetical protein
MPINLFGEHGDTASDVDGTTDENDDNMDRFLLYAGASHVTGNNLGDFLGIDHGRELNSRVDYLVRWGSRSGVGYVPRETTINTQTSLQNNADKYNAMRIMDESGINVPRYTRDRQEALDEFGYPFLGRDESHARGEDIALILQEQDARFTENDFYVDYVPTEREYRMHVIGGEVVTVHEKRKRREAENHPYIRNSETGYIFMEPRETPPPNTLAIDSVGCLGLDFGAVDVIRAEDGDFYVLEVNTAPSLDEANLRRYGERLAEMMGLEQYPGMDNVELEEDGDD